MRAPSVRNVELVFLLLIAAAAGWYLFAAADFLQEDQLDFFINPGFFPAILGVLLLLLVLISVVQTVLKSRRDERFVVENPLKILGVFGMTAVYLFLWAQFSGYFYVFTVVFFLGVTMVLSWRRGTNPTRLLLRGSAVALIVTALIYAVFDIAFSISIT